MKPSYKTKMGMLYCGLSEEVLASEQLSKLEGKVQLIFTSPPYPLNTKKKYGNLKGEEYLEWISNFALVFKKYLTKDGSIVMELGNSWVKGQPTMSTLPMKTLISFLEKGNLNLCQEFICFNPAKLPTPAQWVTIERIRVKDSFTRVWWMSPNPKPKANNKNVLTQYSESMKQLLRKGTYNSGTRPSEHVIGEKSFLKNHGGAIVPNVLIPKVEDMISEVLEVLPISNTSNTDKYYKYCRENNIEIHPARMPIKLVEFFIKFLTNAGDLVLDPFAGSNTTGYTSEKLGRKWVSIEANEVYASSSKSRFKG